MIFLIATMEASTWLSIKLRGHVQTLGEYHRSHRWGTQNTSNDFETDSQTNIYIEVVDRIYGKTKSMLDWPLYTPSPTENASIKWPVQVKPLKKPSIVWTLLGHAWWIGWTFANRLGIQYSSKSFWFGMCLWFIYIYIYIDVWIIGIHMFQNTSTTYSIYQSSPIYMTHWKQ